MNYIKLNDIQPKLQGNHTSLSAYRYIIQLLLEKDGEILTAHSINSWTEKPRADVVLQYMHKNLTQAYVQDIQITQKTEAAPLLFNQESILKKAREELGFSNELTVKLLNELYLSQQITNPDTHIEHIDQALYKGIPKLLQLLSDHQHYTTTIEKLKWERLNRSILKIGAVDNHGILPLDYPIPLLNAKEKALQHLIIIQTLEALSQPCIRKIIFVKLLAEDYAFELKGETIISLGWRAVKGHIFSGDYCQYIPEMHLEENLKIVFAKVVKIDNTLGNLYPFKQ